MRSEYRRIIILFAFAIFLHACKNSSEKENAAVQPGAMANTVGLTEEQYRTAGIKLGKVEMRQIGGTLKASGKLDVPPQQKVSISFPLGGFLKHTELLEGTRVRKGEVIAVIENPEFIGIQQDYMETKSRLEYALADYQRQEELAKENVNAQKTLQKARTEYQTLQARLNALESKRKLLNITGGKISSTINLYAPISGYVTKVNANIGMYISPSDVLFEIVDTRHLHAELTIFEKDIPRLRIGQKVRLTLANETEERTATVHLIGREIESDRTVRVHCHLDHEDPELLPGMYLKAFVETGSGLVPSLPDEAVVSYQGKSFIYVPIQGSKGKSTTKTNDDFQFMSIEIQAKESEEGYTAIVLPENFNAGETQVVIKGAYSLLSKQMLSEEED